VGRFLARRLLQSLITLLLGSFVFHSALSLLPGDPIRALFGLARPDPGVYAALTAQYHFDEPWYARYALYLRDLLSGDLGRSFPGQIRGRVRMGRPVTDILSDTLPVSLGIVVPALIVVTLVGIAVGTVAARRRTRPSGRAIYLGSLVTVATPVVVLAFVLQSIVGVRLGWTPVQGLADWSGYILPVLALSAASTAYVILLTRSELREVLTEVFIHAARARAVPEHRLVGIHALRASLVTTVTLIAANFGQLLTGLVIVEGVFGIPGVGGSLLSAIESRDFSLLIALLLFVVALVLAANLVADVLQTLIDPRIRAEADQRT